MDVIKLIFEPFCPYLCDLGMAFVSFARHVGVSKKIKIYFYLIQRQSLCGWLMFAGASW